MSKYSDPSAAPMLAGLTPAQADAAARDGAVLVLAGAGTGKTNTLTAAVAWRIGVLGIPAARVLAVTFTNKAAQEMQGRIRAMLAGQAVPSWVGTFHGLGARQLRAEPEVAGLRHGFEILDADDSRRLVKRTMLALHAGGDEEAGDVAAASLKAVCKRIGTFKDNLIAPDDAALRVEAMIAQANGSRVPVDADGLRLAARVYGEYQRRLREANAADFGDLLLWPTVAMQRSEVYRRRWAQRFDCILADEYQDVCRVQYVWLRLLAADHGCIFAVGDDDQAIFGFRSADITLTRRFTQDFPGAAQLRLEENFRSTGHILAAANAVIAKAPKRLGKTLHTRREPGDAVEVVAFRDADDEAVGLVAEMKRRQAQEGVPWEAMALLYRSSFLSRGFEKALMRARVPYVLVGDVGFYQRAEIKDALALLRLVANPDDRQSDEAFRRVCNVPARGLGPKALAVLEAAAANRAVSLLAAAETASLPSKVQASALDFAGAVRSVAGGTAATLADQISMLLDRTGYRAMLRDSRAETAEERFENLQELLALAGSFHTARELLDHAALAAVAPGQDEGGRVQLMTLHKSKGLEFTHVFLPAWESGTFPSSYAADADEERRLAYVALTRGMRRVTVSHCEYRRGFALPSPFIDDMPEATRVSGWLHRQRDGDADRRPTPPTPHRMHDLDPAELLRLF